MSQYIENILVQPGVRKKINYNSLANKPQSDTTLSVPGSFADAHAVGARITSLLNSISQNTTSIQTLINTDIASLKSTDQTILSELETINSQITTINNNLNNITQRIVALEKLPARITELEKLPARVTQLEKLPARITELEKLPARITKLEELPAKVVELERLPAKVTKLEELTPKVAELTPKVTKLENDMTASNTNYGNLVKEIEALKNEVNALKQPQTTV